MTKTGTVSLQGNHCKVDPALANYKVECLVFDPFDLTDIDVRHHGRGVGKAVPFEIREHVHSKAASDTPAAVTPTGIDYLRLIQDRHTQVIGQRLRYANLTHPASDPPAELDPPPSAAPPADAAGLAYDTDLLALANNSSDPHHSIDREEF